LTPTISPDQLIYDDFSDLNLDGWVVEEDGSWSASQGDLRPLFGCPADLQNFVISAGDSSWANIEVNVDVNPLVGNTSFYLDLRRSVGNPNYFLTFVMNSQNSQGKPFVELGRTDVGQMKTNAITVPNGQWARFTVKILGKRIKVFQVTNGQSSLLLDVSDSGPAISNGGIAFRPQSMDVCDASIAFDNISVKKINSFTTGQ
jgi:hypothetical protein